MIEEVTGEELLKLLEVPPEEKLGDYALPCFGLAKKMHKAPQLIAGEVKDLLELKMKELGIEKVEQVGAYCNIFLNRQLYAKQCLEWMNSFNHGVAQVGNGKNICMDYSSPNIAKNFHVGHLRTTVIGNSLYKIYEKLGYHVVRIYVKFETESEKNPALLEEARSWFVKMEQNHTEALEIWEWFNEISMVEFKRVYELLGVSFDSYLGESFYRDKVRPEEM